MILIPHKAKQYLTFFIKLTIVCLAFYFIYSKLSENDQMNWSQFHSILRSRLSVFWLIILFLFSFGNRFLEILKWQNLASFVSAITIGESCKQVLAALTAGLFTPNGIGEYAGKAMYYKKQNTKKIIFLNLICNGIQMLLAIIFGLLSLIYLGFYKWAMVLLFIIVLSIVFLFFIKNVTIKNYSVSVLIQKINELPKKMHTKNILLAIGRYALLMHQYYLLFILFGVTADYFTLLATISAVYFIASSLPSFQFLDFVVKGSVALWFFDKIHVSEVVVLFISTFMWFFNVVIPVCIGSYFVLTFKKTNIE
ncbi:hypothetical protein [Flavobacterium nakdongensis]